MVRSSSSSVVVRPRRGSQMRMGPGRGQGRSSVGGRLLVALFIAGFALFSFFSTRQTNEVTGETQYISLTPEQEIQMGLQAVQQMTLQHGGVYPDQAAQDFLDEVGHRLVRESIAANSDWAWEFTLLRDPQTVNAFALPGGQTFITYALFSQLESEDQLAGVMGHEISHVLARHGAQRMAKSELTQGLLQAVIVGSGDAGTTQMAAAIGKMVNMKYGRDDELESDFLGVCIMADAGYDPSALIGVMEILASAGGGSGQPEFFSTHPNPENRIQKIQEAIQNLEACP